MISLGFNRLILKVKRFGLETLKFLQILKNRTNSETILARDLERILNWTSDGYSKNGVLVIGVDLLGPIISFQDGIVLNGLERAEVKLLKNAKRRGFDDLFLRAGALEPEEKENFFVLLKRFVFFYNQNLIFLGLVEFLVRIDRHLHDFIIGKLRRVIVNLDILKAG
jgi:hypothetical protein